jgi:hypothetical protein
MDLFILNISFVRISGSNITSIFSKRSLHLISNLVFSNKLEAQWAEPVSLTFHSALRKLHRTYRTFHRCFPPSFGSLGKAVSEKKIYRNRPMRNKNGLWRPCLLTDPDEMSTFYREPSIDASYQVSIHLAKRFQRRRFLEIGQSETRIACGIHVC